MPEPPPEVLAMVICDYVIEDRETGKKTLVGLFDHVHTTALPCIINELNVYMAFTDGRGTMSARLACVTASTGEEIFSSEGEIEFESPLAVVDLHLRFRGCEFPEEGEYRFQFYIGGELLRERKFYVELEEAEGDESEEGPALGEAGDEV